MPPLDSALQFDAMKHIILGSGLTGFQLAKRLSASGGDVVLIDENADAARLAESRLDCMVIHAKGNSLPVLERAGLAQADALIALTPSDEVNMIVCSLAAAAYPSVLKIARVRNEDYYLGTKANEFGPNPAYGIDFMVNPDSEAAEVICGAVLQGAVNDALQFEDSDFLLVFVAIAKGSPLEGTSVQDVRRSSKDSFLLCCIENEDEAFIPSGETILKEGERAGILAERETLGEIFRLAGFEPVPIRKAAVIGAGRIGIQVAERLLEKKRGGGFGKLFMPFRAPSLSVSIVDKSKELAREASERFPEAQVFNADITDESFIIEENLADCDLVISATGNHELNMVTAAYFKALGARKTVSLVKSSSMASIARSIGSDVAVPQQETVVDCILGHLMGKAVRSVYTFAEGGLEIVEAEIPCAAPACGKPLKDIARHGTFLVLLVRKSEKYEIPTGETVLEEGNRVIFIVCQEKAGDILELFGGSRA